MEAEHVNSEFSQVSVESAGEESSSLLHKKENGVVHPGTGPSEPITFGSHVIDEPKNREGNSIPEANFPKDAVEEWPAAQQIHSFYFIKYRSYEDPKLKAKLELADKEIQKKSQARSQILEKLRAKRSERAQLVAQMKPLNAENKEFWTILDEKRKEMEPLQQALGKLRSTNSTFREKGAGLCSSEEELDSLIKSLQYRIQHESIPLTEEKQILREIKQLEGTREKVIANAAMRAKIQDSMGEKEAIQDQVKLMGSDLDGVRKDQQAIKAKLKQLGDGKAAIDDEIKSLEAELQAITDKREKAYESREELKKQRDDGNASFYKNRKLLNDARELAARKDIQALKELGNTEVEKFMSLWNSNKAIRDDYERRILPSLDIRQLSKDGRMRNPDEKPLVLREAPTASGAEAVTKTNVNRPKEESVSSQPRDISAGDRTQKDAKTKPQKEAKKKQTGAGTTVGPTELEDEGTISTPPEKPQIKQNEVDEAKLKEMRREEEIAKAKQAMERKKKLAEKAAAKAAIKAQKEAEKKLKEREKKAKKKAGASAPLPEPEEEQPLTEADAEVTEELEKADEAIKASVRSKNKDRKENPVRYRSRAKGPDSLPRALLKRKKSNNYWVWAVPAAAALSAVMVLAIGYKYLY